MDLLDESKENIQPLRRGRNISTLNTALQAQTDAEIHHQLMKEREEFEILVRSYVGDDPLQPWYDYVLWVEQNFPKHGREGNLKVLLENCLMQFKDDEQYSQDVRYIDLWTRYISFTDDPLDMYKQIHARGIGAQCAIFYQCWAEEFEKANDMKRADQIYIEGIKRNAQPKDELVAAHTNFQVRVARSILGQNPVMSREPEIQERTALSMLRAHGRKKNMVDSTRVGNSIKRATPGVLRPHTNVAFAERRNGNVQASKVAVYNDENAPITDAVAHPVVKTSVSLPQQKASNKENSLKPARWNEGKFKKKSSASAIGTSVVPATPRTPSFHVHTDENADVPNTPKTDIVASNVLKMRRHLYEDEKNIPVAMFESPDPKKKAMYPKNKVYSGGTEFSLEELRAIIYMKREKERQKDLYENDDRVDMDHETQDAELRVSYDEEIVSGDQKYTSEEHHCQQLVVHQNNVQISEKTEMKNLSPANNYEIYVEAEEEINTKVKQKTQQNIEQEEKKPAAASVPTFLKDIPASGFLKVPGTILELKENVVPSTDMFNSGPSFEQKESDQSLTVNTKAVLNEVKGMWVSSPPAKVNPPRVHTNENADVPKTPKTDIVASNVLKMRRHLCEDEENIPVALFESPDPKKKAMYPKNKVYSGGTELSLEELRAVIYLKQEKDIQNNLCKNDDRVDMDCETQDPELRVLYDQVVSVNGGQKYISEEHHCQRLVVHQNNVQISEKTEVKHLSPANNFEIYVEAEEEMNAKLKQKPQQNIEQKERKPAAASAPAFLKDIPASRFLKVPRTILERKESVVPSTDDMFNSGPSFEQKESDQSLTVNTKAVLNEVKGMWVSSPPANVNPPRVSLAPRSNSQARAGSISTPLTFTPFKIFSDTSTHEPEQVNSVNVYFEKEPEESEIEKEREVEIASHRKEISHLGGPQKHLHSRNLFNTHLSSKPEPQVAEMQGFEDNSEFALYNGKGAFKSFKQEPTSFPQNSSDCTPLRQPETHTDDFRIFKEPLPICAKEEEESTEIPFVPSPGMTPAQLEALKGTEDKENMFRGKCEQMPPPSRKNNILQPSKDVYFVPLEQQFAEDDMPQGNVLSDETCCTEAFAIPLVSSTPMTLPHLKMKAQEVKPNQEEEENTIALIRNIQTNKITCGSVPLTCANTPNNQLVDQAENIPELQQPTPRVSVPTSHLSTIFESSERKRSSMGTTDGSCSSKSSGFNTLSKNIPQKSFSSAYHQFCETEIQEEIEMFRNIEKNRMPFSPGPLMFFSGSFRNHCLKSSGFLSELHKFHCVELHIPFDTNIRRGSSFVVGENRYHVLDVISEGEEIVLFSASEDSSKKRVNIEVKHNLYLWELYIREEIRLRLEDQSMVKHFLTKDKTYVFTNKLLRVIGSSNHENLKDVLEKEASDFVCYAALEIIKIVFHLHQCKIVHGNLSVESFTPKQLLGSMEIHQAICCNVSTKTGLMDQQQSNFYLRLQPLLRQLTRAEKL